MNIFKIFLFYHREQDNCETLEMKKSEKSKLESNIAELNKQYDKIVLTNENIEEFKEKLEKYSEDINTPFKITIQGLNDGKLSNG